MLYSGERCRKTRLCPGQSDRDGDLKNIQVERDLGEVGECNLMKTKGGGDMVLTCFQPLIEQRLQTSVLQFRGQAPE